MKWINIKDRLPGTGQHVLAFNNKPFYNDSHSINIAVYRKECNKFYDEISLNSLSHITHWMPLPEPPNESEILTNFEHWRSELTPESLLYGDTERARKICALACSRCPTHDGCGFDSPCGTRWLEWCNTEYKEPKTEGCDWCNNADLGNYSTEVYASDAGKNFATLYNAGSFRFPKEKQFKFCPECGKKL